MNDMGEAVKSKLLENSLVLFLYFIGWAFHKLLRIEKYGKIPNHAVFGTCYLLFCMDKNRPIYVVNILNQFTLPLTSAYLYKIF